jgi:carbon-monoxide dehydrogenase medium subunit
MASFELCEPQTFDEAFDLLKDGDPAVRPIGGGTALMLMMKAQLFTPRRLVSLRKLFPASGAITWAPDRASVHIGAMTTFSQLEHDPEIARLLPVIPQTMKTLANVRVRNVATVGGNLAHGDPHLDLPAVWMALDTQVRILSPHGERVVPVGDIFQGYYETSLAHDDVIVEVRAPVRPLWRSTYVKITTRAKHDWPALGLTVSGEFQSGQMKDIRLVLSAAVDRPTRLAVAETFLRGATITPERLAAAGEAAASEVHIESDSRGSASYKRHLLSVHLRRTLQDMAQG